MSPDDLTRDGHLTTLSLERHLAGEIDATSHLDSCGDCQDRWIALQADAALALPPLNVADQPTPSRWPMVAGVLAIAAGLAVFVLRPPPAGHGDGVRVKGGFAFEVHAYDGQASRLLVDGDAVAAKERLGFRVKSDTAGHLLILGRDATGSVWLAYPQQNQGASVAFNSTPLRDLKQAITLDATPGDERLTALLCTAPTDAKTAGPVLARGETPDGCRLRQITIRKTAGRDAAGGVAP